MTRRDDIYQLEVGRSYLWLESIGTWRRIDVLSADGPTVKVAIERGREISAMAFPRYIDELQFKRRFKRL